MSLARTADEMVVDFVDVIARILERKDQAALKAFSSHGHTGAEQERIDQYIVSLAAAKKDELVRFYADNVANSELDAKDLACRIFACAGRTDKTNELFRQGAILGWAFACAYEGNVAWVNLILAMEHSLEDNYRISKDDPCPMSLRKQNEVFAGYLVGGHLEKDKILRTLACTDDKVFRTQITDFLDNPRLAGELLERAKFLRKAMYKFDFSYEQALKFDYAIKEIEKKYPASELGFLTEAQMRRRAIAYAEAVQDIKDGWELAASPKPM